jgi:hypothetical protein
MSHDIYKVNSHITEDRMSSRIYELQVWLFMLVHSRKYAHPPESRSRFKSSPVLPSPPNLSFKLVHLTIEVEFIPI